MIRIGILALQGAFIEHRQLLDQCGVTTFEIRQLSDLSGPIDGLILPGGESTVMGRLLKDLHLFEPLLSLIQANLPVYGTCAGAILLAKHLTNDSHQWFQTMNITVKRNAYGRQLGSFKIALPFKDLGVIPMVFIRAPLIESVGKDVSILATHQGDIVAAQEGNQLVTSFHPEVETDLTVHRYFVSMCETYQSEQSKRSSPRV